MWERYDGTIVAVEPYSLEVKEPSEVLVWMRDKSHEVAPGRYLVGFRWETEKRWRLWSWSTMHTIGCPQYPCTGAPPLPGETECVPTDGPVRWFPADGEHPQGIEMHFHSGLCDIPNEFMETENSHGFIESYGEISVIKALWVDPTEAVPPVEDWIRVERREDWVPDLSALCGTPAWLEPLWSRWENEEGADFRDIVEQYFECYLSQWPTSNSGSGPLWNLLPLSFFPNRWFVYLEDFDGTLMAQFVEWSYPDDIDDEDYQELEVDTCGMGGGNVCCPAPPGDPGPPGPPGPAGEQGEAGEDSSLGDLVDAIRELKVALVGEEGLEKPLAETMDALVQSVEASAEIELVAQFEKDGMIVTTAASRENIP